MGDKSVTVSKKLKDYLESEEYKKKRDSWHSDQESLKKSIRSHRHTAEKKTNFCSTREFMDQSDKGIKKEDHPASLFK